MSTSVVIRHSAPADLDDLRRLAALDSARSLLGTVLVAESDGEIRAALSVEEGRAIADPFFPSAELVELLRTRAAPAGARVRRQRGPGRLRPAVAR
jgi:hypothetical protein